MSKELTQGDVDRVKSIAGDYQYIDETKDGFFILACRAMRITIFLLIRALEDTVR